MKDDIIIAFFYETLDELEKGARWEDLSQAL